MADTRHFLDWSYYTPRRYKPSYFHSSNWMPHVKLLAAFERERPKFL